MRVGVRTDLLFISHAANKFRRVSAAYLSSRAWVVGLEALRVDQPTCQRPVDADDGAVVVVGVVVERRGRVVFSEASAYGWSLLGQTNDRQGRRGSDTSVSTVWRLDGIRKISQQAQHPSQSRARTPVYETVPGYRLPPIPP